MSIWAQFADFWRGLFSGATGRALPAPRPPARTNSALDLSGMDGSKWPGGMAYSGVSPTLSHELLRIGARKAVHTSLEARAMVERHADTVIDVGLRLAPTPDADVLGMDPAAAERWAALVGGMFDRWASSRSSIRQENMNFYQAQRMAAIGQQRDGEYFCRFYYSPRRDLLNPLQLGFLDPGQIRGPAYTYTGNVNAPWGDGIERDDDGRETGYKVWYYRQSGKSENVTVPAFGARSGRQMMAHGYQPEYPGQGRGFSRLSHALQEFENITDFKAAEIKKAIAQSCINMWLKPSQNAPASNPFEAITRAPAGPVMSTQAQELAEENGVSLEDNVSYVPLPEATITQPGSVGVFGLAEGEELRPFANTAPSENFSGFVASLATSIAASMSMPLEVVLMKFNQNYSASRAALILFWRIAQIWRSEIVSDLLDPVYENWLAGEISAGRVAAPGWSDPRMRAAWLKATWIGAPMPNIDPQKSAAADQVYAELGAITLDRIALDHNGSSGKANRAQLAREFQELPAAPWKKTSATGSDGDDSEGNNGGENQ